MFVNSWQKPSKEFIRGRISKEALKRIKEHGYKLETIPHSFLCNNAKGMEKRKKAGKYLHMDHNPSNVKVLHLIRSKVRELVEIKSLTQEEKIRELANYLSSVQTLDIITVEQDDKRTLKDERLTKRQKDMLDATERDALLQDEWEPLPPEFKYKF